MFKVLAFIRRKPGMSQSDFREYYETRHVPLIETIKPGMAAYRRNYINLATPFKRDEDQINFDVVTEMEFEDEEACQRWFTAFAEPTFLQAVIEDERNFLDDSQVMVSAVDREPSA